MKEGMKHNYERMNIFLFIEPTKGKKVYSTVIEWSLDEP